MNRHRGVLLLVLALGLSSACTRACQPKGTSPIDACLAAKSLPPAQHLKVCAGLLPRCAPALAGMELGSFSVSDIAEQCGPKYCGELVTSRWCAGERGSPASGFAAEGEFAALAIGFEHGVAAPEAAQAFLEAALRVAQEQRKAAAEAKEEIARNLRLRMELSVEGEQYLVVILGKDAEELRRWRGEQLATEECVRLVQEVTAEAPVTPTQHAMIRAQKEVPFRIVKCVMHGLASGGFRDNIHFEPWR